MRVDSRLPSAVGTTISVTESHAQNTIPMIPPRCPVHSSRCRGSPTLNTERFHKREREKLGHYGTPGRRAVERDTLSMIGCRMKCPKNAVGTLLVGMGPSCRSANRITGDLAADRMQPNVMQELWPEGRYCCHLGELDGSRRQTDQTSNCS